MNPSLRSVCLPGSSGIRAQIVRNMHATGPVGGGISLSWDPVDGADSYMLIMRSTPEVSIWNGQKIIAPTTTKTLLMPAGLHRYFRVMAKNAQGEGLLSAEVDVVSG